MLNTSLSIRVQQYMEYHRQYWFLKILNMLAVQKKKSGNTQNAHSPQYWFLTLNIPTVWQRAIAK